MGRLAFILLDGLNYETAQNSLGYLEHLVESKKSAKLHVHGELPSLSRPMYETIFTGLPVSQHQITNNYVNRLSNQTSVFDLCATAGLTSLAVAYHWISELYIGTPFHPMKDIILHDDSKKIQNGFFYYEDTFPDSHLYSIAYQMIEKYHSDFVFIHPMNIDYNGHLYGSKSKEYHVATMNNNLYLSTLIPFLVEKGYSIIVASDHGMDELGLHGGNSLLQRESLMYVIDDKINKDMSMTINTLQYAPLMCKILGLKPTKDMAELEVKFNEK